MKRALLSLFLVAAVMVCLAQPHVKKYEPTINWPYLLDDFYSGTIMLGNNTASQTRLNFHLRSEALQCIDSEGKVARIMFPNIDYIIINSKVYRFVDGKPMLQVYAKSEALLMDYCYIDFDMMGKGYNEGMALYAREISEISMKANWNNHLAYKSFHMRGEFNESYSDLRNNWYDGEKLPVKHTYYFIVKGTAFRAIASECYDRLNKDGKKNLKSLIKKSKLKWKEEKDLITILQFMKDTM